MLPLASGTRRAEADGDVVVKMRVAILLFFDDYRGGAELHSVQLAECLMRRGREVTLVVKTGMAESLQRFLQTKQIQLSDAQIVEFPLQETMDWQCCRKLLSRFDSDVYVCPKGGFGSGSSRLEALCVWLGRRLVTIEHQTPNRLDGDSSRKWPGLGLWKLKYRARRWKRSWWPARIVTVCETARERFVEEFWYPRRRTVAVTNGVDPGQFVRNSAAGSALREELGIPRDAVVCGMVSRIVPEKGIDVAIAAFDLASGASTVGKWWLVVFGDGGLRADLETQSRTVRSSPRIVWAGTTDQPRFAYSAMDFFLLSSWQEGLPLSLLEAMAAGCVPITTPVGGVPEVVQDGINGFMSSSFAAGDLASAMERAARLTEEDRNQVAQDATSTIQRQFSLSNQVGRLSSLIEECCK